MGMGIKFDDVSKNPEYFSKDIDIIAYTENGTKAIEVKNDSLIHKTGNLFLETLSDVENAADGWFVYSEADLLYYACDKTNRCFIYRMDELRRFVDAQNDAYIKRHTKDCHLDKYKVSRGLCIPLKDVEHICKGVIQL